MIDSVWHNAHGKIILFGEHAAVYGERALAASIPNAVKARVQHPPEEAGSLLKVADWGIQVPLQYAHEAGLVGEVFHLICSELGVLDKPFLLEVQPSIPSASGLGASAALAVASVRALAAAFERKLSEEQVNMLAYACEQIAHGTPSGLDNTLATYGGLLEFQRIDEGFQFAPLDDIRPFTLVVALSGKRGFTAEMVAKVRSQREQNSAGVDEIFDKIDQSREAGIDALYDGNMPKLGQCFDFNHQSLVELDVSCDEIEQVIGLGRAAGIHGAKLTGSGGGGSVILLPKGDPAELQNALAQSGFESIQVTVQSAQ